MKVLYAFSRDTVDANYLRYFNKLHYIFNKLKYISLNVDTNV